MGERLEKTDDLSITFHIVSYRKGKVKHLDKIARTTLMNKTRPYPFGLLEDGEYTNHHNMDAVKLWSLAWPHLDSQTKIAVRREIGTMLKWCLERSLQQDGSFKLSPADDSKSDAMYFGVAFLRNVGFFNSSRRFWTDEEFPQAVEIKTRIASHLGSIKERDGMVRSALEFISEE